MPPHYQPSVLKTWTPDDVQAAKEPAKAFAEYAQQTLGVPWPTLTDLNILKKKSREFFSHYPNADWRTLCRVVMWAANRKKRYGRVWLIVDDFRKAYAQGALPELDPTYARKDDDLQARVDKALEAETDEVWRRRLILADGAVQQKEVLDLWEQR